MATGGVKPTALSRLMSVIDYFLDDRGSRRRKHYQDFLSELRNSKTKVNDWEGVIKHLDAGKAYGKGAIFPGARELYATLSGPEKAQLKARYIAKLSVIDQEFPELKLEFPEQFG